MTSLFLLTLVHRNLQPGTALHRSFLSAGWTGCCSIHELLNKASKIFKFYSVEFCSLTMTPIFSLLFLTSEMLMVMNHYDSDTITMCDFFFIPPRNSWTPARCPTVPYNLPGSSVRSPRLHAQSYKIASYPHFRHQWQVQGVTCATD